MRRDSLLPGSALPPIEAAPLIPEADGGVFPYSGEPALSCAQDIRRHVGGFASGICAEVDGTVFPCPSETSLPCAREIRHRLGLLVALP